MKSKKLSSVPLDNPSVISIANSYGGLSPSLPCYSSIPVLTSTVKADTIVSGAITLPKLATVDGTYSLGVVNNVTSLVPAGGGNPYALINSEIISDVIPDSLCVFTGANKTDCVSDETITIDRNTHQTTINYDLVCEDNISIKNGNVLALYSDDNSNVCSIQCTIDGDLNLVSVQDKKVNVNNDLEVGANASVDGDINLGGVLNIGLPEDYKYSLPIVAPDQDGQYISFNTDGSSSFQTLPSVPGGLAYNPAQAHQDMSGLQINNIGDLYLVSPTNTGLVASFTVRDNGTSLSTNQPLSISCPGQDMELVANNVRVRTQNSGIFAIFNDSGYYVLPQGVPTVDNSVMTFGSNGFSTFQALPAPVAIAQNKFNYYVSAVSGSDANDGSISSPYLTIAACMAFVNTLSVDQAVSINLASGTYNEAVLIAKSGISIIGNSALGCIINGDIGIATTQNSSFYSIIEISNVQINGQVSVLNATLYTNSTILNNAVISPPQGLYCITANTTGGGLLADMTVRNCVLYTNTDSEGVLLTNASMFLTASQIQNNPVFNANTTKSMIKVIGASRVNLFGCQLIQNSAQANVGALIDIGNTSNATSSSTINNSIFIFGAATSTTTGAIMNFSNTASANTYNFYLNYCKCNVSVNSPNNYIVLKSSTGAVNFTQGNNLGTSSNHTIPASGFVTGWVKTTMNDCV